MIYIFDVDGTLTPSRGKMDTEFKEWFFNFCQKNPVFLVTGSDKPKTIEQVGTDIYNSCVRVYNCSGNEVWAADKRLYYNNWTMSEDAKSWLINELAASDFPYRTGLHLEERTGMLNFSIVGRNATSDQRKEYVSWDTTFSERERIATKFNEMFPDLSAKVGGETGIDIFPIGCDKRQILEDFTDIEVSYINFYGDRCDPDGNDYPLAIVLEDNQVNHVMSWEDTWAILKDVAIQ